MPKRVKLLLLVLFTAGIGAFVLAGLAGGSASSACGKPDEIDVLIPSCGDSILQQESVGVDMRAGYAAELTINGTPIPLDELQSIGVRTDASRGVTADTFVFTPGEGKAIEQLAPRQNCATVRYWDLAAGEQGAQTFTWCFQAT
jgi:hypothetical protein